MGEIGKLTKAIIFIAIKLFHSRKNLTWKTAQEGIRASALRSYTGEKKYEIKNRKRIRWNGPTLTNNAWVC